MAEIISTQESDRYREFARDHSAIAFRVSYADVVYPVSKALFDVVLREHAEWYKPLPSFIYHASAKRFESFDLTLSSYCIWFTPEPQKAISMATGFRDAGRGASALVYKCKIKSARAVALRDELVLDHIGFAISPGTQINSPNKILGAKFFRMGGFGVVVDLYSLGMDSPRTSYGVLDPDLIEIVDVIDADTELKAP